MNFKKLSLFVMILNISFSFYCQANDNHDEKKERPMVNIGLSEKNRKEIADKLNMLLANEYVLYTKTLKYHWNLKGKFFGPLHMLFKNQYDSLFNFIDSIAERSLALGFVADGTLSEFSKNTTLDEQPGNNPDDQEMIKNLLNDHETIIKQIQEYIPLTAELDDWGSNNFLCDLIMKHEKIAWMLRAHLQK